MSDFALLAALGPKPVHPGAAAGKRRKKLWEIPDKRHCALIGTCLPIATMRKFAERAGLPLRGATDFQLHGQVVAQCAVRNPLSETIQRFLEKRSALAIARFAKARDAEAVGLLWREALALGDDIAGALWAAWSHPQIDDRTSDTIFGDIHMLSHQVGASARCDLGRLERYRKEAAGLRDTNAALRQALNAKDREHAQTLRRAEKELAAARARIAGLEQTAGQPIVDAERAGQQAALQRRASALAQRAEALEERNAEIARRAAQLEREAGELRAELAAAEEALATALGVCQGGSGLGACASGLSDCASGLSDCASGLGDSACGRSCPAEQALIGRCVLCIGGKTGLVDGYRRIVETRGGRFLHHDGGVEESLHRIDSAVAAADAVVCQAGCISHAAYWRLKEACKKLGKPCVFVKSPGIVSFARSLGALSGAAAGVPLLASAAEWRSI